jgi:hypothetical protein
MEGFKRTQKPRWNVRFWKPLKGLCHGIQTQVTRYEKWRAYVNIESYKSGRWETLVERSIFGLSFPLIIGFGTPTHDHLKYKL